VPASATLVHSGGRPSCHRRARLAGWRHRASDPRHRHPHVPAERYLLLLGLGFRALAPGRALTFDCAQPLTRSCVWPLSVPAPHDTRRRCHAQAKCQRKHSRSVSALAQRLVSALTTGRLASCCLLRSCAGTPRRTTLSDDRWSGQGAVLPQLAGRTRQGGRPRCGDNRDYPRIRCAYQRPWRC
jgi:hypothetical protein